MTYELEIKATDATNVNAHFFYNDRQEMLKALDMILRQGYDVIVSEVREDG